MYNLTLLDKIHEILFKSFLYYKQGSKSLNNKIFTKQTEDITTCNIYTDIKHPLNPSYYRIPDFGDGGSYTRCVKWWQQVGRRFFSLCFYSRTSMARTLMARLPRLFRTCSWVPKKNSYNCRVGIISGDFLFLHWKCYISCSHKDRLDETILTRTQNILSC